MFDITFGIYTHLKKPLIPDWKVSSARAQKLKNKLESIPFHMERRLGGGGVSKRADLTVKNSFRAQKANFPVWT